MYIHDALFSKVSDPITMGILFFLVSVADNTGNVYMSCVDIGNKLGYNKTRVYRCIQKLVDINAVNLLTYSNRNDDETQVKRKRNAKVLINVCNIMAYKSGETLMKRNGNASETQNNIFAEDEKPETTTYGRYFEDEKMNEAIIQWLAYKKEKKQSYKPIGLRMLKTKLLKLSHNNGDAMMKIVEQSIMNNYAGLFPLKGTNSVSAMDIGMTLHNSEDKDYEKDLW